MQIGRINSSQGGGASGNKRRFDGGGGGDDRRPPPDGGRQADDVGRGLQQDREPSRHRSQEPPRAQGSRQQPYHSGTHNQGGGGLAQGSQGGAGRSQSQGAAGSQRQKGKDKQGAGQATAPASSGECFRCGRSGHFQSECSFEPLCIICSKEGHSSASCPTRGKPLLLQSMGHTISGGGFFNIDVEPIRDEGQGGQFAAVIKFRGAPLSESQLSDELKNLVDDLWDWQVSKITDSEFTVHFPSRATLKMSTGSGKLYLPLRKTDVEIREAFLAPQPGKALPSTWVRLTGVPRDLLEVDRLMAAMVMVGRPLELMSSPCGSG
nr:uncharacterized protein LOC127329677 [Lolium perenne]